MIAARDGLHLTRVGLRAFTTDAQNALDRATGQALVSSAARGPIPDHADGLVMPRPSGLSPWVVEVLPLRPDNQGASKGFAGAVLIVTDTEGRRLPSERLLAQLYGLSPAEASLASSLAAGATIAEHAALRGISMPTARTQLANVLSKTNSGRQAELVSKIALAIL
jgi:DNA-binding CsgD family transcriptional regulator